jgi:hypothetical protein
MKADIKMVLVGIVTLLMIIPAVVAIGQLSSPQILTAQPVTRENGDNYQTSWMIVWDNTDPAVAPYFYENHVWSVQMPTLADLQVLQPTAVTIVSVTAETADKAVYPVAPWIVSLLQIIVPLTLVASSIIAFSYVVSSEAANIYGNVKSFGRHIKSIGQSGKIAIGELLITVVSILVSVIIIVKITPIIYAYTATLTGVMGFGLLIALIPVILLIAVLWMVFHDLME